MRGRLVRLHRLGCTAALFLLFFLPPEMAVAKCQLQQVGTLPVDMQGPHPIVRAKINGVEAPFMLDTGAFYSTIWRETATQYQLPITSIHGQGSVHIRGPGGEERAWVATAESFQFLSAPIPKVQFLVIDQGNNDVGVLGENLLEGVDAEYDLANGIVRFFQPVGCARQPLAYWAVSTPYSFVDLESIFEAKLHLSAKATLNGRSVLVWFDTGASHSVVSLDAAERAGINLRSPGVTYLGTWGGFGAGYNKVWSAPFDTFQLGGEKVQHAHLLISDLGWQQGYTDMILGADFFLSHRIYVAYSQRKLYFTYNGGPLFNLNLPQVMSGKAAPPKTVDASTHATAATGGQADSDAPTDADGFRRRGMAYASMHDLDHALADLSRACDLAPNDAENYYDRGMIHRLGGQFEAALKDFGVAIKLQPDDIDAHLARALLLQAHPDTEPAAPGTADIKSDLDTVARLAAPSASLRLTLEDAYDRLGDYSDALDQINEYLDTHPLKDDQSIGFNHRCWVRATANQHLNEALDDCNRARSLRGSTDVAILDSRALVYLRLGRLSDSIEDYDSALRINPNVPTSLYGRGLAELRVGDKDKGQADIAAAEKLDQHVAQRFAKMGLTP
jgi:tetratricopeptide (TPR) repeat protein/predicted aspartyl protease